MTEHLIHRYLTRNVFIKHSNKNWDFYCIDEDVRKTDVEEELVKVFSITSEQSKTITRKWLLNHVKELKAKMKLL